MQWRYIENNWDTFKVIIKQHWVGVTDQQLDNTAGKRASFSKVIENTYGISSFVAEYLLFEWQESIVNIDGHFYHAKTLSTIDPSLLVPSMHCS